MAAKYFATLDKYCKIGCDIESNNEPWQADIYFILVKCMSGKYSIMAARGCLTVEPPSFSVLCRLSDNLHSMFTDRTEGDRSVKLCEKIYGTSPL